LYNILRLLHTIRHLKLIQIYYQIKYRIQNKLDIDQCFIRKYDRLYNLNWKNVEFNLSTYKSDNNFININHPFSELIDLSGNVIENDVEGEIVATSYDNTVMPLIRYKTGDYTSYCDFKNKILNKISGKWGQDLLFGYNKDEISITALNLHSEDLDDLLKLQFVQNNY
jgi:phenylacetate-coenzyme A ligase PaaK-like adenylate-forming protein